MQKFAIPFVLFASAPAALFAQTYYQSSSQFFDKWQARATATQALQPKWNGARRLALPHAHFRSYAPTSPARSPPFTPRHGTSVPAAVLTSSPSPAPRSISSFPFFEHSDKTPDGFGDFSFSGKYRILSANEKHGNYLLSGYITAILPTGSYKNGATNATITSAITGSKGFEKFDTIATISSALLTGNTATIGRTLSTNVVFQYHVQRYICQRSRSTAPPGTAAPKTARSRPSSPRVSCLASIHSRQKTPPPASASPLKPASRLRPQPITGRFLF
jgi:hypothetical protein